MDAPPLPQRTEADARLTVAIIGLAKDALAGAFSLRDFEAVDQITTVTDAAIRGDLEPFKALSRAQGWGDLDDMAGPD